MVAQFKDQRQRAGLFVAVGNASPTQIVRAHFNRYLVTGEDLDVVHPHLPGDRRLDFVVVFQPHPEHCVREGLFNHAILLDQVFFGHVLNFGGQR